MKKLKQTASRESSGSFRSLCLLTIVVLSFGFLLPVLKAFSQISLVSPDYVTGKLTFIIVFSITLALFMPSLMKTAFYNETKRKLEGMEASQSTGYSDEVIKLSQQAVEMQVSLPIAWDCLKEASNGLDIKAMDKRRAAWLVDSVDDDSRTVRCSLQYMQDPMGRKLSQIYPRAIEMVASIDGSGLNTKLRTRYTFRTPMDLEAVSEIISKTNSRLNEMIVTADKSYNDERELRRASAVAQLEKPMEFDFDNLGSVNLPISLN